MERKWLFTALVVFGFILSLIPAAHAIEGSFFIDRGHTMDKPQSKFWFHDGTWWAVLGDGTSIFFYRAENDVLVKKAMVEDRSRSRADVVWNGTHLFVLMYRDSGSSGPRLYKYSYDTTLQAYTLLAGFPVELPLIGADTTETMTIAQDSTGQLWAAYAGNSQIRVIWSTSADHTIWDTTGRVLYELVDPDDIAAIVAFNQQIIVAWSNQAVAGTNFGVAVHHDGDAPETWSAPQIIAQGNDVADDHLNFAVAGDELLLATKASRGGDHIELFVFTPGTGWSAPYGVAQNATRPIVVYDEENDMVYVFYTDVAATPSTIVYKKASLTDLLFGPSQPFLAPTGVNIDDVTSTKDAVNATTGLVAAAKGEEDENVYYSMVVIPVAPPEEPPPGPSTLLDIRIATGSDDAEERKNDGKVDLNSTDLDLGEEHVALRFTNVAIPQGATIVAAYVQFTAEDASSQTTTVTMTGEASDNALAFQKKSFNLTNRPRTSATVNWSVPAWAEGVATAAQQTPDLAAITQEIVDRPGWASGHALVLILDSTGARPAMSYERNRAAAPLLHVEYSLGPVQTVDEPDIDVTPLQVGFNLVQDEAIVTITNYGTQTLSVTDLSIDNPVFSIVDPVTLPTSAAPLLLAPGASTDVLVQFTPISPDLTTGQLSITSDDPDEPVVVVDLSGVGTEAAITHEETQSGGSTEAISVTTSTALTGVHDQLYLAVISTKKHVTVTGVSGLGLTWTLVDEQCAGRNQTGVSLWFAQGAVSGNGTVTATFASAPNSAVLTVSRYSGVHPTNPLGAVVSGNTNGILGACSGGTDSASYAFPLTTTTPNATIFSAAAMRNKTHTPGVEYTELIEVTVGSSGSAAGVALQDRAQVPLGSTSVEGAFNSTVDWAVIAVELVP